MLSTHFLISTQLILPEGGQSRVGHTATALSLGPGWTQVTMFGGCPKWESGKSLAAQQRLAITTVLGFGEQITFYDTDFNSGFICLLLMAYS